MTLDKRYTLYIPLGLLTIGSILFRIFPWDMEWADEMHSPEGGWDQDVTGFWQFLYDFGVVPAVLLLLGAFVVLVLGVGHPLKRYRKLSYYVIACMALGPGLITNGLLKEFWGRPRPKQVSDFGGQFEYEPLLTIDLASSGKSFPCGHATMGFIFFSLAFVLLHRSKKAFFIVTGIAVVFGLLIGYARLVQGGHFPSDTMWAMAVCWFSCLGLYHLFRMDRVPLLSSEVVNKRPWWGVPALIGGCVAIVLLISLATPYEKSPSKSLTDIEGVEQIVVQSDGVLEVIVQETNQINYRSHGYGHRLPKSRHKVKIEREGGTVYISVYKTGLFTELNLSNVLVVPPGVTVVEQE